MNCRQDITVHTKKMRRRHTRMTQENIPAEELLELADKKQLRKFELSFLICYDREHEG